jgi:hypothetical protein
MGEVFVKILKDWIIYQLEKYNQIINIVYKMKLLIIKKYYY